MGIIGEVVSGLGIGWGELGEHAPSVGRVALWSSRHSCTLRRVLVFEQRNCALFFFPLFMVVVFLVVFFVVSHAQWRAS